MFGDWQAVVVCGGWRRAITRQRLASQRNGINGPITEQVQIEQGASLCRRPSDHPRSRDVHPPRDISRLLGEGAAELKGPHGFPSNSRSACKRFGRGRAHDIIFIMTRTTRSFIST